MPQPSHADAAEKAGPQQGDDRPRGRCPPAEEQVRGVARVQEQAGQRDDGARHVGADPRMRGRLLLERIGSDRQDREDQQGREAEGSQDQADRRQAQPAADAALRRGCRGIVVFV